MFTGASYWLSAGHYPPCKHSVARTPDSKFLHAIRTTNRIRCWASRCRRTSRCRSTLVKRCSRTIFFSSCKINFISSSDCTFWPHNRFIHANRLGLPISRVSSCATILSLQVSMWKSQCECLNVEGLIDASRYLPVSLYESPFASLSTTLGLDGDQALQSDNARHLNIGTSISE